MYLGTVIGFRSWRINPATLGLDGPVSHVEWPPDRHLKAECVPVHVNPRNPDPHLTPDAECGCGLYAYHGVHDATENYCMNTTAVVGVGVFWGRIQVHTAGFKAQHGRILAISDYHKTKHNDELDRIGLIEGVVERYSIPVIPTDLLEPYGLTFGEKIGTQFDDE